MICHKKHGYSNWKIRSDSLERLTNRIKQIGKDDLIVYTKGKYEDTVPGEMSHDDIRAVLKKLAYYEDAEEERGQLDKALNELKRRREYDGYLLGSGIVESAYSSGYKKAIDDFAETIKTSQEAHLWYCSDYGLEFCNGDNCEECSHEFTKQIDKIAERLKAGGTDE